MPVQTSVGSLDPSDAFVCDMLAAPNCGTHGGLYRNMGPPPPSLDYRLPAGAASFTTSSERGKTHLTHNSFFKVDVDVKNSSLLNLSLK